MAQTKIGNQQLIDPILVDEIYDLGVELSLSPCGVRSRGGEETNMICLRDADRVAAEVEHVGLTRVESYTRFPAYIFTPISDRSIGERGLEEKPVNGKETKVKGKQIDTSIKVEDNGTASN